MLKRPSKYFKLPSAKENQSKKDRLPKYYLNIVETFVNNRL